MKDEAFPGQYLLLLQCLFTKYPVRRSKNGFHEAPLSPSPTSFNFPFVRTVTDHVWQAVVVYIKTPVWHS